MPYVIPVLQIAFISALSLIGQWLSTTFKLPLPGNLVGMFLLLGLLLSGIVKVSHIEKGADLLLKYMSLFFIPAGVGLLAHLELIKTTWLSWLVIIAISTAVVLVITAKTVDFAIKKGGKES